MVTHQAPLFMEFSRQEYSSGLPLPSPGDLSDPGIKPTSPVLQVVFSPGKPLETTKAAFQEKESESNHNGRSLR